MTDENDNQYIAGNLFMVSKWIRENTIHPPPKFKVGDVVVVTMTYEVTGLSTDCDGSPLYILDDDPSHRFGEQALRLANHEELVKDGWVEESVDEH